MRLVGLPLERAGADARGDKNRGFGHGTIERRLVSEIRAQLLDSIRQDRHMKQNRERAGDPATRAGDPVGDLLLRGSKATEVNGWDTGPVGLRHGRSPGGGGPSYS